MRVIFKRQRSMFLVGILCALTMHAAHAQPLNMESDPVELAKAAIAGQRGTAVAGAWHDGKSSYGEVQSDGISVTTPAIAAQQPLFEIGSITKVFTGVLLAQAVERGDLSLDDNLGKLLAGKVSLDPSVAVVTLRQLITHSSCLPRMPANFEENSSPDNPYVNYDRRRMWAALSALKLAGPPPCDAAYSNLGVAVVGQLLSERYNKPWDVLVHERITGPLGMNDTVQNLGDKAPRLATAFNGSKPASRWDMQAFAGAGSLRSTAADMLIFGRAILAGKAGPLGVAAEQVVTPLSKFDADQIGYAMMIIGPDDKQTWYHSGLTGGYSSLLMIAPDTHDVVVVFASNTLAPVGVVNSALRVSRYKIKSEAVAADASKFPEYVGVYRIDKKRTFTFVTRHGELFSRLTGQFFLPLTPTGEDTFSIPQVEAEYKFARNEGKLVSVTLTQRGGILVAPHTDEPILGLMPASVLQAYAGHYRDGPDFVFNVTDLGGLLAVKFEHQPTIPGLPVAGKPDWFASDIVDAQVQFERDAAGKVIALVLHQNGDHRAVRLTAAEEIAEFASQPLYLRGSMNEWGLANPLKAAGNNIYSVDIALGKGKQIFKVCSKSYDDINLGAIPGQGPTTPGEHKTLAHAGFGQDLAMEIKEPGKYTFRFDVSDPYAPVLTVDRIANQPEAKL